MANHIKVIPAPSGSAALSPQFSVEVFGLVVDVIKPAGVPYYMVAPPRVIGSDHEDDVRWTVANTTEQALATAGYFLAKVNADTRRAVADPDVVREPMRGHSAVVNGHVNHAHVRAMQDLTEDERATVNAIDEKHNGIMGIFNEEPNPATRRYVDLVTGYVNENATAPE